MAEPVTNRPAPSETGVRPTPGDLLSQMGIVDPKKERMLVRELSGKQLEWTNLAVTDVAMGPVFAGLRESGLVDPPRTGHMGGVWSRIAEGAGGSLMLNQVIRQEGIGHPLIFDQNEIPVDTLYYPGSIFNGHRREELPLYTWQDGQFAPAARDQSVFTPFVMTEKDGSLVPLTAVHKKDMETRGGGGFQYISDLVVSRSADTRELFAHLLDRAQMEDDLTEKNRLLAKIADRALSRSGHVADRPLTSSYGQLRVGDTSYTTDEVINMLMLPFHVGAEPELLKRIGELPKEMPRISKEMLAVLIAVLNADFVPGAEPLTPVNPHFHWGALQMAGAPPFVNGYFAGSASDIRSLMAVARVDAKEKIPPCYYILMPAAVCTLWPSRGEPQDIEAMNALVASLHRETDGARGKPNVIADKTRQAVSDWNETYGASISPSLRSRFSRYDSSASTATPASPIMVKPEGFDDLTFRQASMAVGALTQTVM